MNPTSKLVIILEPTQPHIFAPMLFTFPKKKKGKGWLPKQKHIRQRSRFSKRWEVGSAGFRRHQPPMPTMQLKKTLPRRTKIFDRWIQHSTLAVQRMRLQILRRTTTNKTRMVN
jgi:hypothetical protein